MIPKIIHQIWVGDPMPAHLADYRRTVLDAHPGWEHRLWTEEDFGWLQNQQLFNDAERHAPGSEGQFRSDVARYEILRLHGGVYLDCDIEARAPLDGLLDVEFFAGWEVTGRWVNNAVMGSVPRHSLLIDLVDGLPDSVQRNRGKRPNRMTGPQFLTPLALDQQVTVHPQEWFYPYRWNELDLADGDFPDALLVHHCENARKRQGKPRA